MDGNEQELVYDAPAKAGWRTSEFYVTAVVTLAGLGLAAGLIDPGQHEAVTQGARTVGAQGLIIADAVMQAVGAMAAALASLGYAMGRGRAKAAPMVR